MTERQIPFKTDENSNVIPGGSQLLEILNVAANNGAWTAITATKAGKGFVARMAKDGANTVEWDLSLIAAGTTYLTVAVGFSMNLAFDPGVLFYVNPAANGTLQVLVYG